MRTEPLSGYERLKVLHDVFNMDSNEPFRFSFDMVARTGLSSKDFIAPTSFDFREGKCFKMGKTIGAVSFLQILAPELNDRMLADFLETVSYTHLDVYKRQNLHYVIEFDIKGFFDNVNHSKLMRKIWEMGIKQGEKAENLVDKSPRQSTRSGKNIRPSVQKSRDAPELMRTENQSEMCIRDRANAANMGNGNTRQTVDFYYQADSESTD